MARPKKDPEHVASALRSAKLYPEDDELLDRLIAERGARLREQGTADETFAGWLRETIRQQSRERGWLTSDAAAGWATTPKPAAPKRRSLAAK